MGTELTNRTAAESVSRMGRNTIFNTLRSAVSSLVAFATGVVVARALGPDDAGLYALVVWVALAMAILFCDGLNIAFTKAVSQEERSLPISLTGTTAFGLRAGVLLAAVGAATMLAASGALAAAFGERDAASVFAIGALFVLGGALIEVFSAPINGLERQGLLLPLRTGWVTAQLIAAVVTLIVFDGGVEALVASQVAVGLLAAALHLAVLSRLVPLRPLAAAAKETRTRMLRATLALTASSTLGLLVFTRSAVLLLGYFATTSEVAYYSIAFAMADALQLIVPMSLSFAVIPNIARAFSSGQADFARRIYEGHVRLTALAVLPVAVAGAVLSEAVVHVFYGEAFADAALPLAVLLFAAGVKSIGFCAIWLLVGSDREQLVVWVYGAAAAAKVVVGLACIPSLGVTGALYAEIVSQLVLVAAGALAVRRAVGFGFPAAGVARIAAANLPVLAAAAAAIAVLENDAAAILVGIAAVPPAYALGLWAFRALSPFERSYLRERFAFAQLR